MAGVIEGFAVYGVTEILQNLIPVITEQIRLAWGAKDELEKLKEKLGRIMAVVTDAEQRQVKENPVNVWLEKLKGLAYDVDDILDDYSYKYMRKHALENRKRDLVRYYGLPSTFHPFVFPIKMGNKIKDMNTEFHKIALEMDQFKFLLNVGPSNRMGDVDESNRETSAYLGGGDFENIVGRESNKCDILKMLLATDSHGQVENFSIIPIVGMGGAGKTTLAQLVYNDESVKGHFKSRSWVHVSEKFDIKKVSKDIKEQVPENLSERYLLVLDDLWNNRVEEWDNLKKLLPVGAPGSKILVTTRNEKVAKMVAGKYPIHRVEVLKEEECWSIFQKLAFGAGGPAETPILRDIGKEIVRKCGGLPLAAKTLGSLMRSKEKHEWEFMRDHEIRNIPEDESRIIPILKLSYNHLPSHLKQCFSYCAIFPKSQTTERKTLIQLWMAEGFIQQYEGNNKLLMEDIGNDYFYSLLRNSLFQNVEKDNFEEVTTCKMHDLVHDLALDVAGISECLIVEAKEIKDISQVRRLHLLNFDEATSPRVSKALKSAKKLRTLFLNTNNCNPMTENIIKELFKNNKLLRVLDLSRINIEELPSSIRKLKHLRYLDLSYTNIKELPNSISELYSLQTLKLTECVGFTRLPKDTNQLFNLRHLITNSGIIPRHLRQLTCLRTLQEFRVCHEKDDARGGDAYDLEELGSLNLLGGELTIRGLENLEGKTAQRANLKDKSHLRSLSFEWGVHSESSDSKQKNEEMVLEGLQPHRHLKSLCIDGFGGAKLPTWMGLSSYLPNLLELTLRFIHEVEQLPSLGELPSLKILVIEGMAVTDIGEGFSGKATNKAFPSLKELTLKSMIYLETFFPFPHLEKLKICECPYLKEVPTYFPSLKELLLQGIERDMIVSSMVTRNIMSLTKIEISGVAELQHLPLGLLQNNSTLQSLEIDNCPIFEGFKPEVPSASGAHPGSSSSSRSNNSSLESLELRRCPVLTRLPDLGCFTSLRILKIFDCKELIQFLPLDDPKKLLPSLELLCVDDMWESWSRQYEDYGI